MLMAIVEARKREEEELHREAERALAKRKKFKEVRCHRWRGCVHMLVVRVLAVAQKECSV
jgi:hypothetical protein